MKDLTANTEISLVSNHLKIEKFNISAHAEEYPILENYDKLHKLAYYKMIKRMIFNSLSEGHAYDDVYVAWELD